MKLLKYKKLILSVCGILLVFLVIKVFAFFTVKPKITVDYVAQFNQLSRPENYTPNDNAASFYQKAFDAFVEMPDELYHLKQWQEFNEEEKALLENWLTSNVQAFKYLREAVEKPYYFVERISSDVPPTMGSITLPELNTYRDLINAMIWNARFHAANGQFSPAFEDLFFCYRTARHKCQPNLFLIDQYLGLRIKNMTTENALLIIDKYDIKSDTLNLFQNALRAELNNDSYTPGLQAEKLSAYDGLQRVFIDNSSDTGRWAWSIGWHVRPYSLDVTPLQREYKTLKERLYYCLIGPDRKTTAHKINELIALSEQIMNKTPWQIKNGSINYFDEIKKIKKGNLFLEWIPIDANSLLSHYYKTRAQTEALIAVLAILRHKNDTSQLPESLDQLVSTSYLHSVPNDPYSNGPLIYTITEDGFKLYSVGEDFTDNGGITDKKQVFSREISLNVQSPDIVYWPIEIIAPSQPEIFSGGMMGNQAAGN